MQTILDATCVHRVADVKCGEPPTYAERLLGHCHSFGTNVTGGDVTPLASGVEVPPGYPERYYRVASSFIA